MNKGTLKKNWQYIAAFFLPVLLVLIHCITRNSWLFGEGSILREDAGVQYVYVFYELWNRVHSGDFSMLSWNAVGGYDFLLNVLYYAISPATLVVLLLPKALLEDALQFFMVIKWSLLVLSAVYYFMNTRMNTIKENKQVIAFVFGICYGLNGFFIDTLHLFNWLDTIILFPILLLLIEKMIEKGKWKLYCAMLAVAILCNFYIAFPICIFLAIYFGIVYVESKADKKRLITFLGSSVLSAVMSMVAILPSVLNVGSRYTETESKSSYLQSIGMGLDELIRKFWIMEHSGRMEVSFYCSIGCVMLACLYIFAKQSRKEKGIRLSLVAFMVASVMLGALRFVWQGFSIPHGFDPRFGFILIFVILLLAIRVLENVDDIKMKWSACLTVVCFAAFIYAFFQVPSFETVYSYMVNMFVIVVYGILFILVSKHSIKKKTFMRIFICMCLLEMVSNGYVQLDNYDVKSVAESNNIKNAEDLIHSESIDSMQRIALPNATYNSGMRLDQASASGFISYFNGDLGKLADVLGIPISKDSGILYTGSSPVCNTLFNVSYGVDSGKSSFGEADIIQTQKDNNLYKLNGAVGYGYMVNEQVMDWNLDNKMPFAVQNDFVKCATDIDEDVFEPFIPDKLRFRTMMGELPGIDIDYENAFCYRFTPIYEEDAAIIDFEAEEDMPLYLNLRADHEFKIGITIDEDDTYVCEQKVGQHDVYIGEVKKGQMVKIVLAVMNCENEDFTVTGQIARLNREVWDKAMTELSSSVWNVETMTGNNVSGTIKVEQDGLLMTSIPAMNGFSVYVDGEKTSFQKAGDALIAIPLSSGEHTIEMKYATPYAGAGVIVSLLGVVCYLICCFIGKKKNV